MNILKINTSSNISFRRAIRPDEEKDYGQTIADGKNFLDIKNLALVMHGSSFPQADRDLFIGSPFNKKAVEVNDFLKMNGFDSIQLGPPGLISKDNYSPYNSSINSKNYLFTDMSRLATDEYANILSDSDIEKETSASYETSDMTNFGKAFNSYDRLFEKAYDNLKDKNDKNAINLKGEYTNFKQNAGDWLESDAMYNILQTKYNTTDFEQWPDVAKNLMQYKNDSDSPKHQDALDFIADLKKNNSKELGLYKFKQFIVDKQEKGFIKENPGKLNYISDAIIGFSMKDLWGNQDAFLKDYRVGCPGGGDGNWDNGHQANQVWNIPVVNPKTLFNEDGSLGKGGLLFKQKFENLLDTYQNVRVDHVLGLIDPWIYNKNDVEVIKNNAGKIVSTNAHGAFLSELNADKSIDPNHSYQTILEKIVLPILKEKNLDKNDAVWESLGNKTDIFNYVYYGGVAKDGSKHEGLKLPDIVDIKWNMGETQSRNNWLVLSTHDDPPFEKIAENRDNLAEDYYQNNNGQPGKGWSMKPDYLMGVTYPEKTDEERGKLINDLNWDTRLRVITKGQELMRYGEKIQISFMDFFGLDKTYNEKGHENKDNWKLRLSKDYKKDYYKTLENKDVEWQKIALNMPELLKRAVISKIYTTNKSRTGQDKDFQYAKPLIDKLDYYEKVLYEKEDSK